MVLKWNWSTACPPRQALRMKLFWNFKTPTHRTLFGNVVRFSGFQKSTNLLLWKLYWKIHNASTARLICFSSLPMFSIVYRFICFRQKKIRARCGITSGVCPPSCYFMCFFNLRKEIWIIIRRCTRVENCAHDFNYDKLRTSFNNYDVTRAAVKKKQAVLIRRF